MVTSEDSLDTTLVEKQQSLIEKIYPLETTRNNVEYDTTLVEKKRSLIENIYPLETTRNKLCWKGISLGRLGRWGLNLNAQYQIFKPWISLKNINGSSYVSSCFNANSISISIYKYFKYFIESWYWNIFLLSIISSLSIKLIWDLLHFSP